jgi:ABC-type amino acid transport substrate-binding protein
MYRFFRLPWTHRRAAVLIALALLVIIGGGLMAAYRLPFWRGDTTLAQINQAKVWRVGLDPSFPPFEQLDAAGQPVGFDVDLARAIGRKLGVQVQIVSIGFDQLLDAVAVHRVDSAISAMTAVDERPRDVWYSAPYQEAGLVLAVPRGSPITGPAALVGRRVAAEWGSEGDAFARREQQASAAGTGKIAGGAATAGAATAVAAGGATPVPPFALVLRESPDAALDAVVKGDADAVIIDAISLALYRGGDLVSVGAPLQSNPYVVVVPARASGLLTAVNQALAELQADGTLAQLRARWLGKS